MLSRLLLASCLLLPGVAHAQDIPSLPPCWSAPPTDAEVAEVFERLRTASVVDVDGTTYVVLTTDGEPVCVLQQWETRW